MCTACAVGNIIAGNFGVNDVHSNYEWVTKTGVVAYEGWASVFYSSDDRQIKNPEKYTGLAKIQIDKTGYSWRDLAKVEKAFESVQTVRAEDDDEEDKFMFLRLMAVIDVLDKIHENTDTEITTSSKQRFLKQTA